jgi:hypothetical protein
MACGIKRTLILITVVLIAAGTFAAWKYSRRNEIPIPDEKAAAMALLVEKLSGPRYFNAPAGGNQDPDGPWIGVEEVRLQEDRVIRERHWGQSQRDELDRLISQLSEPRPARMVGGYRIPLERLNLALDAFKE